MIEEEMKVGPKGQVVIPGILRKALKVHPGSKIIFRLEGDKVVLSKPDADTVGVLERISVNGPSVKRISPHLYEKEIRKR